MRASHKIVAKLFCLVACLALCTSMPLLMALEVYKFVPGTLYECYISTLRETGDELHPDYAMNPYYLRLDLDGDGEMDYVTILVDESGKVRRGLLVCSSEGKATFYQGVENSERRLDTGKCPPVNRVVESWVLTEERSSRAIPPRSYLVMKCCRADGEMTSAGEYSTQTIPIGLDWYTISKSDLLQNLKYYSVPGGSVELAGEGVGSSWGGEDVAMGFLDGNRFRWLFATVGDCPE